MSVNIYICMSIYIYIYIYTHKILKEKTKQIFIENVSATVFTNSLLSTSHFSLMIHFEINL